MLNETFGDLTVISDRLKHHDGKRYRYFRNCICVCGTKTRVREDHLKSGNTENCGCKLAIPSTVQRNLTKRIEGLEMQWQLLKVELKSKEEFYERMEDSGEIHVIHDIQSLISKMETGEYYK